MTKFTITIEKQGISGCGVYDTESTTLEVKSFNTLKEAKKELRRMVKHEGYVNGYSYYNSKLNTELNTNF